MGNMSHCRFQNTLTDLRECLEALSDGLSPFEGLSEAEAKAARRLIRLCRTVADDYEDEAEQA